MMLMNEVLTNGFALDGVCGWGMSESWDQNLIWAMDPLPPSPTTHSYAEMKVKVESLF